MSVVTVIGAALLLYRFKEDERPRSLPWPRLGMTLLALGLGIRVALGHTAELTNLDFSIDAVDVGRSLGVAHVRLLNDLQTLATAVFSASRRRRSTAPSTTLSNGTKTWYSLNSHVATGVRCAAANSLPAAIALSVTSRSSPGSNAPIRIR